MAVVGIDLGTTYSCVSSYVNGKCEIIPDKCGHRLIPSFVYYDPTTGEVFVGKTAYELSTTFPANFIRDAKRLIGRRYDDTFVTEYMRAGETGYRIVNNLDMAGIQVEINGKQVVKSPEAVSAEILKHLKEAASTYLNKPVEGAVISIPAYFSNAQRKATRKAAELAGITVLKLLTEPTAGAIHYMTNKNENCKLLVPDWGGGTLDVSLVQVQKKIFKVKAVYGDTLLGGRNIDKTLFQRFYTPVCRSPVRFQRRLMQECIVLKEELSVTKRIRKIMEYYDGVNDLTLSLDVDEFNRINDDIFERVKAIVEYALEDSGWNAACIDMVVLVGGSTRIPRLRELLKEQFEEGKLKTDLNPDEAVAMGAGIEAHFLKEDSQQLEKLEVTEVTPLSLGCDCRGDIMTVFIMKNTHLPATTIKTLVTGWNNVTTVGFRIYEGERKNVNYNNKLAVLGLTGLPLKRAGDVKIRVEFHLDIDGILTVSATETSTGNTNSLAVTMGEFHLSERNLKMTKQQARKFKHEDELFETFTIQRNHCDLYCEKILYDIEKIKTRSDRLMVRKACDDFHVFSKKLEFTEIEALTERFKQTHNSIKDILASNNMLELTYNVKRLCLD